MMDVPFLSVIVHFRGMRREAPRTLHSLSRAYQRMAAHLPYEVIVIDKTSSEPLSEELVRSFGPEFRYVHFETIVPSPVPGINHGVSLARGQNVMIMIDGAHLLSPGVLFYSSLALRMFADPFVCTVGFHLGPGPQHQATQRGYNKTVEDELLASLNWKSDGYELFRAAGSTADASMGWLGCLFESNCFAMRKSSYEALGGLNSGYVSEGGGMANLDLFRQALESPAMDYVLLLGEGTFHQLHNGVSSSVDSGGQWRGGLMEEYERIRGKPYVQPLRKPTYLGQIPRQALPLMQQSAQKGLAWREKNRI